MIPDWIPNTWAKWQTVGGLVLGAVVGWLLHPVVWLVAGPFRFVAMVLGMAAQESSYSANAVGAADELGPLQFLDTTWTALGGSNQADRSSGFWSGYRAAEYVQQGILADWRWVSIIIPAYGFALLRYMWTSGPGSFDSAWGQPAWERAWTDERNSFPAFMFWRSITFLMCCQGWNVFEPAVSKVTGKSKRKRRAS